MAVVSGAIYALKPVAPVVSLGSLYVFAVLFVAVVWGIGYALATSVASMLAFNWFFLPPAHTLRLHESENWFALAVYLARAGRRRTSSLSLRRAQARHLTHRTSWRAC